jgi:hypothetical protein
MECPDPGSQHKEFLIQLAVLLIFFQKGEADLRGGATVLSQEARDV